MVPINNWHRRWCSTGGGSGDDDSDGGMWRDEGIGRSGGGTAVVGPPHLIRRRHLCYLTFRLNGERWARTKVSRYAADGRPRLWDQTVSAIGSPRWHGVPSQTSQFPPRFPNPHPPLSLSLSPFFLFTPDARVARAGATSQDDIMVCPPPPNFPESRSRAGSRIVQVTGDRCRNRPTSQTRPLSTPHVSDRSTDDTPPPNVSSF